ncbi:hypothetical protein QA584_08400 [Anaerocolumna sp. AGMB13025]|uniref:hypothetical protein n=1 Tax=Anaerocolumna sp. AGMB13025 TaxID=3039116 RepID=UPI00241FA2F1|nr:hypothetical protein [Anaerocolumna sp. AGMB13025]WFR59092.1 hypothetical protein QA584_08400 [Anaerocolumna sp. AGMB13025]
MEQEIILTQKEVMETGLYFDGDIVYYGGEYGQQVCRISEDGVEEPVTGVVYELYKNRKLNYYCYYIRGISNGQYVCFYENGNVKSISYMYKGTKHGKSFQCYDDGKKKYEGSYKYGYCESFMEWDDRGILVKEQTEPTEFDKKMIKKYENYEQQKN